MQIVFCILNFTLYLLDDPKYEKPTAVCAKDYVSLLMEWVESLLNNENVFPTDASQDFPKVCFDKFGN